MEMTAMKVSEMFAEAIPGVIIQLIAIATSKGEVGTSAWLSISVSAFCHAIAFCVALVWGGWTRLRLRHFALCARIFRRST